MNNAVLAEYKRFRNRNPDISAAQALRNARTKIRFAELEAAGLVKLDAVPEWEPHDDSYVDTWGLSAKRTQAVKAEIAQKIDCEGLWAYASFFRKDPEGKWLSTDSVGDVIGDIRPTEFYFSLMKSAVDAYDSEPTLEAKYS